MCEYPQFINFSMPIARKPHHCEECGIRIGIGEKYQRVAGKWAGDFGVTIQCQPCAALWDWLNTEVECLSFGGLREGITDNDMLHELPRDLLSHNMLMWIHKNEIEEAENEGENPPTILPPVDQMLAGLMQVHKENCSPRLWKRARERMLEQAARAGGAIAYYRKRAAEGSEWCQQQLEKAAV